MSDPTKRVLTVGRIGKMYGQRVQMTTFLNDEGIQNGMRLIRPEEDLSEHYHFVFNDVAHACIALDRPLQALCGKRWYPTSAPEVLPPCPKCNELRLAIQQNEKESE